MSTVDTLKGEIQNLLKEVSSEDALYRVKRELEEFLALPKATEEEERQMAEGRKDIIEGHFSELDDFLKRSEQKRIRRIEEHGNESNRI